MGRKRKGRRRARTRATVIGGAVASVTAGSGLYVLSRRNQSDGPPDGNQQPREQADRSEDTP